MTSQLLSANPYSKQQVSPALPLDQPFNLLIPYTEQNLSGSPSSLKPLITCLYSWLSNSHLRPRLPPKLLFYTTNRLFHFSPWVSHTLQCNKPKAESLISTLLPNFLLSQLFPSQSITTHHSRVSGQKLWRFWCQLCPLSTNPTRLINTQWELDRFSHLFTINTRVQATIVTNLDYDTSSLPSSSSPHLPCPLNVHSPPAARVIS